MIKILKLTIIDLMRLSPRDMNYKGENNTSCVLRYELIQNYINT